MKRQLSVLNGLLILGKDTSKTFRNNTGVTGIILVMCFHEIGIFGILDASVWNLCCVLCVYVCVTVCILVYAQTPAGGCQNHTFTRT